MIIYFISFILLNLVIYFMIDFFIQKFNVYDFPDSNRKKHQTKVSVFGGGLILINLIILFLFVNFLNYEFSDFIGNNRNLFTIFFSPILIFFVGLFDDKLLIKNKIKFISLIILILSFLLIDESIIIVKLTFSWSQREIFLLNFSLFFSALCILTFMNSYNFLDGIDLLCGIYALIIFLIFFYLTKSMLFFPFIVSLIIFCFLNYKKKLFLGDSGALLISFLISLFMIKIYKLGLIKTEQIFIILFIPILDNLRVFFVRFINKQNILTPDNNHLHHLLVKKLNNINTVILVMSIIFIPYIISNIFSELYIIIIFQIIIYFFLISKFKNL